MAENPPVFIFHLTNLALPALNALLLFSIGRRLLELELQGFVKKVNVDGRVLTPDPLGTRRQGQTA